MKADYRERGRRAAAAVAEQAASVRSEPERVARLEKWQRKADEPARRAHSNGMLALDCYVRAVGYDPAVRDVLWVALTANAGEDGEVARGDALMGVYLEGGDESKAERVANLPAHDREKRTLAQSWKRALTFLQAEEDRAGFRSLERRHGTRSGGKNRVSRMRLFVAQDLVEIEKAALKLPGSYGVRGARRFRNFTRAAAEYVARLRDEIAEAAAKGEGHERMAEPTPAGGEGGTRKAERSPAQAAACSRFVAGVDRLGERVLRDCGGDEGHACEMFGYVSALLSHRLAGGGELSVKWSAEVARVLLRVEKLADDLLAAVPAAEHSRGLLGAALGAALGALKSKVEGGAPEVKTDVHKRSSKSPESEDTAPRKGRQNEGSAPGLVFKTEYQTPDAGAYLGAVERLLAEGRVDYGQAADFRASAHDPATRAAFFRRYGHPAGPRSVEELEEEAVREEYRRGP